MLKSPRGTHAGVGMGLVCLLAGSLVAQDDELAALEKRLEGLQQEFKLAEREMYSAYSKAVTPAEQAQAQAIDPWEALHERVETLAFEAEGTEVGAGAWAMIFTNEFRYGDREQGWEAFGILINDHADSPHVQLVAEQTRNVVRGDDERGLEGLHLLLETSSNRGVQAASLFCLAKLLEPSEATREEAFGYYRRLVADYADIEGSRGLLAKQAEGALFESEFLQVGLPVPDVTTTDETGASFRLSDYKGKVVLVDFWGFW